MVKRVEAALLTCKPDVRAYILHLNDQQADQHKFLLSSEKGASGKSDSLLVKRKSVTYIKKQVRDYFDSLQVNRDDFE